MMLSLSTKIIAIVLGLGLASPIYAVEIVTNIDETMVAPVGEKAVIEKNIEVNLPSVKSSISVEVEAGGENSSTTTAKIVQSSILHTAVSPVLAFLNKIFNYVLSIFS